MQASVVEYTSNDPNLGVTSYISRPTDDDFLDPGSPTELSNAFERQCKTQIIKSSQNVQNFSVLGLIIVVVLTAFLLVVSLTLETIMKLVRAKEGVVSYSGIARQLDDKFHLLRMALGKGAYPEAEWMNASFDVPITQLGVELERPGVWSEGLSSYRMHEDLA
jgi:hypothetical protein